MQRIKLTPIPLQYIVLIYFEVRWQFNLMKDVHIPSIIEIVITYFWTHNKKRKYKIYIYIYLEEIQNIIAVKSARTLRKWLKIG